MKKMLVIFFGLLLVTVQFAVSQEPDGSELDRIFQADQRQDQQIAELQKQLLRKIPLTEPAELEPTEPETTLVAPAAPIKEPAKAAEFAKISDLSEIIAKVDTPEKFAAAMKRFGIPTKAIDIDTPKEEYVTMLRTATMIYYGTIQLNGTTHKQLQNSIARASAVTDDGVTAAMSDLTSRVESLELNDEFLAGQILEVNANMEKLREAVNSNGVDVTACLNLLKYTKYNSKPKEADRVEEAVENSDFDPVIFEGVPIDSGE